MSPTVSRQEDLVQLALTNQATAKTTNVHQSPDVTLDFDDMMDGIQTITNQSPPTPPTNAPTQIATGLVAPLNNPPARVPGGPTTHMIALGPTSYANALKRPAERAENEEPEKEPEVQSEGEEEEEQMPDTPPWPKYAASGPIKGFSTDQILAHLDPQVRESWEDQLDTAILVHYLDGGYNPNIAQNVHIIAEDLKSEYSH